MNWAVFGLLWGASLFLNWLFEHPTDFREKLVVGFIYTAVAVVDGLLVPPEHTVMGLAIVGAPLLGGLLVKIYRHNELEKVYG